MTLERNFFRLLDLPQQFFVDLPAAKKTFRALQREFHPDRFVTASAVEQRKAAQMSAHVNSAWATVSNPVSRAGHLLELQNIEVDAQNQTIRDGAFLMQQMELREEFEDARSAADEEVLKALHVRIQHAFERSQDGFASLYQRACDESLMDDANSRSELIEAMASDAGLSKADE